MSKYFIINTVDRPYERLITEKKEDGKFYYVSEELADRYAEGFIGSDSTTDLETFGFMIEEDEGEIRFRQVKNSEAMYSDGEPRSWQGAREFTIKKVVKQHIVCKEQN